MSEKLTPMMKQYLEIKEQHQDSILFFRLGDFYEMFMEDATVASKELEITLTGRDGGLAERIPMCGVPFHSADGYIKKLVDKGYKVAICEQVEDPKDAKGIVKREVVKIITPGTILNSSMLDEKRNNYIIAVIDRSEEIGIAYADLTTGEFGVTSIDISKESFSEVLNEIQRLSPAEIIISNSENSCISEHLDCLHNTMVTRFKQQHFNLDNATESLCKHFKVMSLHCFGCSENHVGIMAAGGLLAYLIETQKQDLSHISKLSNYHTKDFMLLDVNTRRNLEISQTIRDQKRVGSLLWVLDYTETAMGARKLKQWLESPLIKVEAIKHRQNLISVFINNSFLRADIKSLLTNVYDLERLLAKISLGSANARDLNALKSSFFVLPAIYNLLQNENNATLEPLLQDFDDLNDIFKLIDDAIYDDPPFSIREGNIIKSEYNEEVTKYRTASSDGKQWLANLEAEERAATGIKSLRVSYNKVFGYFIEVTKSNLSMVPEHYIRKQTLSNAERFITPELKEYEALILGAHDKLVDLEYRLFVEVRELINRETERIQKMAELLARLDALMSLAEAGVRNNYCKPEINHDDVIAIKAGRHPVVERMLTDQWFVPNDCCFNNQDKRLSIITGPNMAGKSTYMRQTALIVLMAQIGSYVPADSATIGIVDRIFTRVGASDDLATGQSTFMVEMNEVANILNNATNKSLIILDEIGRGTSTFDGLSIAWAVAEYILDSKIIGAKTLFATHYHELTELARSHQGVANLSVAVKEQGDDIIFLRQIIDGGADRSYGIQVAKLAGLPEQVIERAKGILATLENSQEYQNISVHEEVAITQLSLFEDQNPVIDELLKLDILKLTPLQALNILYELQSKAKG